MADAITQNIIDKYVNEQRRKCNKIMDCFEIVPNALNSAWKKLSDKILKEYDTQGW